MARRIKTEDDITHDEIKLPDTPKPFGNSISSFRNIRLDINKTSIFLLFSCTIALILAYFNCFGSDPILHRHVDTLTFSANSPPRLNNQAYVTLVASDEYVLPARVLARSIRASGCVRDTVVMVTGYVSLENIRLLEEEGLRVAYIPFIANPFWPFSPTRTIGHYNHPGHLASGEAYRKWSSFCKLNAFQLDEYERIAYLDADTLMLHNGDGLFECGGKIKKVGKEEEQEEGSVKAIVKTDWGAAPLLCVNTEPCTESRPIFCMNHGVFVTRPSKGLYDNLVGSIKILGTNENLQVGGLLEKYWFLSCVKRYFVKPEEISSIRREFPDHTEPQWLSRLAETVDCAKVQQQQKDLHLLEKNKKLKQAQTELITRWQGDGEINCGNFNRRTYRMTVDEFWPNEIEHILSKKWPFDYPFPHVSTERVQAAKFCYKLPYAYNARVENDVMAEYIDLIHILHFSHPLKPWNFRSYPYYGFYSMWNEMANNVEDVWAPNNFAAFLTGFIPVLILFTYCYWLHNIILPSLSNRLVRISSKTMATLASMSWCIKHSGYFIALLSVTSMFWIAYLYLPGVFEPFLGWALVFEWTAVGAIFCLMPFYILLYVENYARFAKHSILEKRGIRKFENTNVVDVSSAILYPKGENILDKFLNLFCRTKSDSASRPWYWIVTLIIVLFVILSVSFTIICSIGRFVHWGLSFVVGVMMTYFLLWWCRKIVFLSFFSWEQYARWEAAYMQ